MTEKTCGKYCREHLYYALRFARKHDIGDDEHNKECVALRLDDSDTDKIITALEQHESLSKQASQRGARLQIMRDWMKSRPTPWATGTAAGQSFFCLPPMLGSTPTGMIFQENEQWIK